MSQINLKLPKNTPKVKNKINENKISTHLKIAKFWIYEITSLFFESVWQSDAIRKIKIIQRFGHFAGFNQSNSLLQNFAWKLTKIFCSLHVIVTL